MRSAEFKEPRFEITGFLLAAFYRAHRYCLKSNNAGLNGGLNEGLKTLLQSIKNHPGIKAKDLRSTLNRPVKTIERQIKSLIEAKLIERRGSRKTGGYYVTGKD